MENLEKYFEENRGLVYSFAKQNRLEGVDRDEYIQLLLIKYWELIKIFDWSRYSDTLSSHKAFISFLKKSLLNYLFDLKKEQSKENWSKAFSLDYSMDENGEMSFLDLLPSNDVNKENQYCLFALYSLKDASIIEGYLIDYIEGCNISQIARKHNCSRGKVVNHINMELEELRKVI